MPNLPQFHMKGLIMMKDNLSEKRIYTEEIYNGAVVHLVKDTVELPNGKTAYREIVKHNGAVCVLPITDDNEVICVRQYRHPFERIMLELPAGKLDTPDEDHREAALRELREETGAVCEELIDIGSICPSVAIFSEQIYLFIAKGLTFGETDPDDDEFLELVKIPFSQLKKDIIDGKILDGKTQIAVLKAAEILGW